VEGLLTSRFLSGTARRPSDSAALSLARRFMILDFNLGIRRMPIEAVSMGFESHGNLDWRKKNVVNMLIGRG
jgi:hypothetical protein